MYEVSHHAHYEKISFGKYPPSNLRASRFPSDSRRGIVDEFQALMRQISTRTRVRRDQIIFSEGENCTHFYMVVSGAARVCSYLQDGSRQITGFMFPNDYFGLIPEATYSNTVEATCDTEVLRYSLPKFLSLADKIPTLRKELLALLSERFRTMQNHILALGKQTAQERVASFLVTLFENLGTNSRDPFEIPMSRQDVADYLALRIETISRVMTVLAQEHFIAMSDRHKIVVTNVDALRLLSRGIERD